MRRCAAPVCPLTAFAAVRIAKCTHEGWSAPAVRCTRSAQAQAQGTRENRHAAESECCGMRRAERSSFGPGAARKRVTSRLHVFADVASTLCCHWAEGMKRQDHHRLSLADLLVRVPPPSTAPQQALAGLSAPTPRGAPTALARREAQLRSPERSSPLRAEDSIGSRGAAPCLVAKTRGAAALAGGKAGAPGRRHTPEARAMPGHLCAARLAPRNVRGITMAHA